MAGQKNGLLIDLYGSDVWNKEIKYVHSVQNTYYETVGEEPEFKPTKDEV